MDYPHIVDADCRASVPEDAAVRRVLLQPSSAWGDGGHPTTRMIVQWLNSTDLQGKSVLDYGCAVLPQVEPCSAQPRQCSVHVAVAECTMSPCRHMQAYERCLSRPSTVSCNTLCCRCGSGVLGISAALLGAKRIVGLDIDPDAVHASKLNAQLNVVGDRCCYYACEPIPPESPSADDFWGADDSFEMCVANIFQKDLINLRDSICRLVRPGGTIVMSGLLLSQACAFFFSRVGGLFCHAYNADCTLGTLTLPFC